MDDTTRWTELEISWTEFEISIDANRVSVTCPPPREGQSYSIPQHGPPQSETTEKHYRPTFKDVPSDMVVKEGKMARLNCRVRGRPPPDLVWYRNDTIVRNDHNHRVSGYCRNEIFRFTCWMPIYFMHLIIFFVPLTSVNYCFVTIKICLIYYVLQD